MVSIALVIGAVLVAFIIMVTVNARSTRGGERRAWSNADGSSAAFYGSGDSSDCGDGGSGGDGGGCDGGGGGGGD